MGLRPLSIADSLARTVAEELLLDQPRSIALEAGVHDHLHANSADGSLDDEPAMEK